jgi:hypothetical protein
MGWLSALRLVLVVQALGLSLCACFAPKMPPCAFACGDGGTSCPAQTTCGTDGFCHGAGETAACGDARAIDAAGGVPDSRIRDANVSPADAPETAVDARRIDAPVLTFDAALPIDASLPDASPPDAARPDAAQPDAAPDCTTICADPRVCENVGGCDCGVCEQADWCEPFCFDAVCEANNCCLPEDSNCDFDDQCCSGLSCLGFCTPNP